MSTIAKREYFNVGVIDATLRVLLAIAAMTVVLTVNLDSVWRFILSVLSIPVVLFAVMRWDPIYKLIGVKTTKDKLEA
jgi:hypothetical protein